jgi:rhodanese-related sulfurtransferase
MSEDAPGPAFPVTPIAAADLRVLLEGGVKGIHVLDTRTREEYERGHVPGSLHCPVHELSRREKELPPRTCTMVVVGEPGSRGRAGGVFLLMAGYGNVLLLEGGFPAWDGAVETGEGAPLSSTRPPKPPGWVDPPRMA